MWHGTHVASVAASRKFEGSFSGIAYNTSRLVSVRVLGKDTLGYSSDVADGLVWAVGGQINGVEDNLHPAKIVMMAFSGLGKCPSFMQLAVNLARSRNITMFAAAGNNPNL